MRSYPNPSKSLLSVLAVLAVAAFTSPAQVLVKVDTTKPWQGYMNVFNLPSYGAYQFGSAWGPVDLTAFFTGTNFLTLMPNTNQWKPTDNFWVNTNTVPFTGNKFMEANFYVENTALRGQLVNFTFQVLSNNLVGGTDAHLTRAFVKTLNSTAGYSLVSGAYEFVELTNSPTPYEISINVYVPAGDNMIPQYGFVMTGPNANPDWVATNGLVRIAVDNADPAITSQPANARVQVGTTASFSIAATGGSTISYQWKRYGTNLANGGNISGATSATLTIANAQYADETVYRCTVTDLAGSLDSEPATLRVKSPADFVNCLDDSGFEDPLLNPDNQIPKPWVAFAGANIRSTNANYAYVDGYPIQTIDGTNAAFAYNMGEWNGGYQDTPVAPGQILTADASCYVSLQEQIFGDLTGWLEVQFRGAGGLIRFYKSHTISASSPVDTWITLSATNGFANDFVTPIGNARYLVAPPGTTHVRYQMTIRAVGAASGVINFDGMKLLKKNPVTVSASKSGSNIVLSWPSQPATNYQVVYKDDLTTSGWTPVGEPINGDGTTKSTSFPASSGKRFYSVLTL